MQIVVKNLLVDYFEAKKANARTLLFLHGWRSQKETWLPVTQELQNDFSIYALDLPGFGRSQLPPEDWSGVGEYADLVQDFILKLDLQNVYLVGHSFGGRVAIKLAARNENAVRGLVLVDSAGFAMRRAKKNILTAVSKMARPFFRPACMQGLRRMVYRHIGAEDYLATPELQKIFVRVTAEDLTADMRRVPCPTVLIYGLDDADTPPEYGRRMRELIANSRLVTINGAGHFSFLDKPKEFVRTIREFCA